MSLEEEPLEIKDLWKELYYEAKAHVEKVEAERNEYAQLVANTYTEMFGDELDGEESEAELLQMALTRLKDAANEANARADKAERLLHDLTPGGSEFVGRPERCAEWAHKHISELIKVAVDANVRANKASEERDTLLELSKKWFKERDGLRESLELIRNTMHTIEWGTCTWCRYPIEHHATLCPYTIASKALGYGDD